MPFVQLPTPKARRTLHSGCIEKAPADSGLFYGDSRSFRRLISGFSTAR